MRRFSWFAWSATRKKYHYWGDSICKNCGMGVRIETHPAPNSTSIHGEAVALNCPMNEEEKI